MRHLTKVNFTTLILVVVVGCAANDDAMRLANSDENALRKSVDDLIQPIRESSRCNLTVLAIGPDLFGDSGVSLVQLGDESPECDDAISKLNERGQSKGIAFISIKSVDFPAHDRNDSGIPLNVDLIHEIDPQEIQN